MHKLNLWQALLIFVATMAAARAEHVWIEAERPVDMPKLASRSTWGEPDLVSDQMLVLQLIKKDADGAPVLLGLTAAERIE